MKVEVKLIPSGVDEDGEDQFLELDAAIVDTLRPLLREACFAKVDEIKKTTITAIVHERLAALATDAFAASFQQTDMWGQKKGEPQSLAEIVSTRVQGYLDEKVDDRGASSYGGDRITRCQWMVKVAIRQACKGEIDKRLETVRAEFAEHLAVKLAKVKVS